MSRPASRLATALLATSLLAGLPGIAAADGTSGRLAAQRAARSAAPLTALAQLAALTAAPVLSPSARGALAELRTPAPAAAVTDSAPASVRLVVGGRAEQVVADGEVAARTTGGAPLVVALAR